MPEPARVERRHQFCVRCGQLMFDFFRSPDGHFGLAGLPEDAASSGATNGGEVRCPACGARYRVLERLSAMGAPVERR